MDPKQSRLNWRRAQAARVREDRIITAYLKAKHPGIYNDAASFYNELNQKYPNKHDLRKVKEFKELLTWNPLEPQGEHMEKRFPNIPVQPTFTDRFQLRIPLLQVQSTVQLPPVEDNVPATQVQSTVQLPPVEDNVPVTPVQLPQATPVQSPPPAIEKEDLVHITEMGDDMLNKIVCDLQNDPFIHDFFDNMEINELSPLEAELLLW